MTTNEFVKLRTEMSDKQRAGEDAGQPLKTSSTSV